MVIITIYFIFIIVYLEKQKGADASEINLDKTYMIFQLCQNLFKYVV